MVQPCNNGNCSTVPTALGGSSLGSPIEKYQLIFYYNMYQNRYINITEMIYVRIMNDTKLDKIFGRNYNVLQLFLEEPGIEFYLTEAAQELRMNKMSVYRTLEYLVSVGMLESRSDNYKRFYKVRDSHLIRHLKILFNLDSVIVGEFLKKFKNKSKLIILYGSRATGTEVKDSDWDFILVSNELEPITVNKTIASIEKKYDVQINVKLYTSSEYNEIRTKKTPFYREIKNNKVLLEGEEGET